MTGWMWAVPAIVGVTLGAVIGAYLRGERRRATRNKWRHCHHVVGGIGGDLRAGRGLARADSWARGPGRYGYCNVRVLRLALVAGGDSIGRRPSHWGSHPIRFLCL
jgi:hypothetical protein